MSVDILAIGEKNQKKNPQTTVLPAWQKKQQLQGTQIEAPGQRAKNTLDRQVEIGLGSRVGNLLSKKEKQIYADGLSEKNWNLMQRYKAEGYSFEASKALVENQKKLKDPYASGTNKYDNYEMKENYYNRNGVQIDPESNIGKLATFMQKVGFNDTYGNPLNQLAQQYNEWYAAERDAMDYLIENEELNLLQRFGWWLEKGLLTAESGIIGGLGKIGNAVQGVEDIKSSAIDATLDRAIKGLDTDLDYYRQEDRRLDEYLWEGASGGLNTIFWAWAPKMMTVFSYIGETKAGGTALEFADNLVRGAIERGLDNGLGFYYNSLDEQGKEDMLDTMTTLAYMKIAKKTNKRTGKLKTTKVGIEYESLKNQFRKALNEGWKGAKEQAGREVSNVKNATDLYGENGTKIGKMGPEGQVGVGDSISRVVQAGVNNFKQSFIDRLNARHGGTIAEPGTVETPTAGTGKPTDTPTTDKGVVEKTKDLATQTWDTVITGLTPEERIRIQNDPYTIEKWNKARQMIEEAGMPLEDSFITEQLYNEIGENIKAVFEEWENKLGDTSPYYGEIRKNPNRYNLIESMPKVYNLLAENDIVRDPISGELDFSNSKFVTDSDMRSVQRAMNMIEKALMVPSTPREYLNLRDKLKQLASYTTVDASRGQALIRQLRHAVNEVAHKQIPGLKDLDKVTHKYFNEIEELKEGWVYKEGDRKGELRNNFYSIIKNLTGQNRKVMLDRLEKYYPGIEEEIEAIHIVNKMVKAYNKSPQMLKGLGLGGALGGATISGGLVGALVGAIAGEMINKGIIEPWTKSKRKAAIEKLLSKMSPEAKRKLEAIARKQITAKELSKEDQAVLDKVAEIIRNEREKGLGETALKEWKGGGMFSKGGTAPQQFKEIKFPSRNLYELATEDPIEKFDGKLTEEQKRQGKLLYQIADKQLDGWDIDSDNEIIAARGKFLVMNQKPGYTKALGLDQGKVNESIRRRWEENGGADEKLKQFNRWINDGIESKYRFTGITNLITYTNPRRNVDAINFLVKDVKGAEDIDTEKYKKRIDATIDSLLLMDAHFNHGETNIRFTTQAEMNKYALELAKNKANGEFVPDILTLVAGQGQETIPHEIGHEGDAIIGAELFGMKFIRNSGHSEWFATGKPAIEYLKNNGRKWHSGLEYKTPEALEFHREMIDLLNDIQVPEWMKNDERPDADGKPMSEYRTRPEEKWARFRQANITLTRQMNQTGKVPKKTYKSDHGDVYPIELYKRWAQLLQKHQKLADAGAFHEVEPINRSGISTANGLKDYAPRQLTPEELEHKAGKMIETWGDAVRGFDIDVMLDKFDPDLRKRQKRVEKVKGKDNMYSDNDFMDFFLTLKAMSKDPEFMEGLRLRAEGIKKAQANGTAYGSENITRLYDMLSRKDLKLTAPKGQRDIDVINEELLEPIRRWLIQSGITRSSFRDVFATLGAYYSPDTIQWQNNLEKSAGRDFKRLSVKDLKELEGYIKDLIEKGEVNLTGYDPILGSRRYTQYTINGEMPDRLIDVVERGIGDTFTDKRIKEVANDMWDTVMDPMREILKEAIVGWMHVPSSELTEFFGKVYYAMGETYTTDMKERTRTVNEKIKKIGDEMGIALNRDRVVPEQKLQGLNAKLRELMAVGPDLGEYIVKEGEFDYNPTRNEWIRDLVKGAYERRESNVAQTTTEATKQLVALSNMDVDNFEKQIKNFGGKSPMPSIAITDVNVPHTAFGDLTLVFGRDTVDPQVDSRNKIYASDAWTTTFPDIKDAGGFTWDNAKELAGLIKDRITTNVDSLTLTEAGLDSATIDLLANRIVNAILDNGYDAEYLRGWQDVGDTAVEQAVDNIGLDWYENEGLYQDLQNLVANYVKEHQPTQVIPGYYFKGQVRYDDPGAVRDVVDKIYNNLTEKGIQKLKDDGWNFDESDQKYVINQKYKDTPPKQGIQRDIDDIIERITDYPNLTPTEAGKEFVNLLTEEYGFEKKMAIEIAESIFGEIAKERLTPEEFAEKLSGSMPLNDGDMGVDFGNMYDHNLEAMNGDIEDTNKKLGKRILEERDDQKNNVDGPQAMNHMLDMLLDEREKDIHDTIDNYVTVDLREKDLGDNPTFSEEKEWLKEYGEKNINEIMGGVDASLTDMALYVKDLVNEQLLVEDVDRDRPLTPENVLEAMRNQGGPRRDVTEGSLRDLVGVEGKEFTDIEQVRNKNLAKTTHDDRTGDLSAIEKRYDTIINEIRREFTEGEPDIPMEMSSQVVKQEIAWNYDPDLETFKNNLIEENEMWEMIPDDYLQAIIDCVEMGKQVPIRFSESKPERIVDLYKEVEYILVPKQDLGKVNDIVRGTPLEGKVHMYDRSGFKSERSDRIKSLQKRYGNIFFGMGGIVMPIAMLLMMVNQQEETA